MNHHERETTCHEDHNNDFIMYGDAPVCVKRNTGAAK